MSTTAASPSANSRTVGVIKPLSSHHDKGGGRLLLRSHEQRVAAARREMVVHATQIGPSLLLNWILECPRLHTLRIPILKLTFRLKTDSELASSVADGSVLVDGMPHACCLLRGVVLKLSDVPAAVTRTATSMDVEKEFAAWCVLLDAAAHFEVASEVFIVGRISAEQQAIAISPNSPAAADSSSGPHRHCGEGPKRRERANPTRSKGDTNQRDPPLHKRPQQSGIGRCSKVWSSPLWELVTAEDDNVGHGAPPPCSSSCSAPSPPSGLPRGQAVPMSLSYDRMALERFLDAKVNASGDYCTASAQECVQLAEKDEIGGEEVVALAPVRASIRTCDIEVSLSGIARELRGTIAALEELDAHLHTALPLLNAMNAQWRRVSMPRREMLRVAERIDAQVDFLVDRLDCVEQRLKQYQEGCAS